MLRLFRVLIAPPTFDDDEKTRQARLAYLLAVVVSGIALAYTAYRVLFTEGGRDVVVLAPFVGASLVGLLATYWVRRGRVRLASVLLVVIVWLAFAWLSGNLGGVRDPGYAGFIGVVVLSGLLLGGAASLVVAVVSVMWGSVLLDAEARGVLPPDTDTQVELLLNYAALFLFAFGVVSVWNRGFRQLVKRLRQEERDMRAQNWQLQRLRDTLEQRVAERTVDLDRRSRYLEAAARVAYAASEILDPAELINESVELIRQAFDLYYVGLFLVDDRGEWAVLQAGTGEAGRKMLARRHRIKIGQGMIGWCIAHEQSRFAQHAEEDRVRLVAPELPDTRAEAALPLRARGRVLGAITVQSTEVDFFDEAIVVVLQTMADLVAIALSNAELYEESQRAVDAVRRAYGESAAEAWEALLAGRRNWGYRYRDGVVRPVTADWDTAARDALTEGRVVEQRGESVSTVAVPLRIGDRILGAIQFERALTDEAWSEGELELLTALADQLAQALDVARLYEETQRGALRERVAREVTDRMRAALEWDELMQTAVQEVARTVGASRVFLQWVPPTTVKSSAPSDVDHGDGAGASSVST